MREEILHFIWQHQYYKLAEAFTEDGDPIMIAQQGILHSNSGPDFEQAKVIIGDVEWNGAVEIHIKSSAWDEHRHHLDKAYNKVVLHVVWEYDKEVYREDKTTLPTLVLKPLVSKSLIVRSNTLLNTISSIPCDTQIEKVPHIIIANQIQRSFIKRLERKGEVVLDELTSTQGDWDEVAYRLFMKQMGMKVNGDTFYELSLQLPYSILRKYVNSIFKIEALLFGVSGFLQGRVKDDYMIKLDKEFQFLATKHDLNRRLNPEMWKFLRLRPSNFPTLRLAQSAAFLCHSSSPFNLFIETSEELNSATFKVSSYWKNHYKFKNITSKPVPVFGKASFDLLRINVVAPLLAAYGKSVDNDLHVEKAVLLLEKVKSEQNAILKKWKALNITPFNAAESQGLLELFNESCKAKKCLSCGIGYNLIKE